MDRITMPNSSILTLFYPVPHIFLTLYLVPLLPYPSITLALSAYATFSLLASMLGLLGLRLRSPTLLFIFSHHLLLDVFLSLIPQLALLAVFHDFSSSLGVCPAPSISYDAQKSYGKFHVPTTEGTFGKLERMAGMAIGLTEENWCIIGLQVAQAVLGAMVVVGGVAQWRAAMGLRRLAVSYEMSDKRLKEKNANSDEKENLEKH
ncbi:hypothetical protein B9Z65_1538 [Elsinoe australis]|uniref:Uncharacterized protein n=1 Tax=Elsinoe australis TaxID=40998 RepID=A0A2P7YG63_9PEZI|nr:hypothetical protein B9Z65_1538 [Elsinoe australis]